MRSINNLHEAEKALFEYVPNVAKYIGDNMSLDRMWQILDVLGNPQADLRVIHIAGTSGKTSTSYYCAELLARSGRQVGLTVSPHVNKVTERFQVNGQPIDESLFCVELSTYLELISKVTPVPSYFELLIGFVLWESKRLKLDYLVVETGMGGLYDATNVLQRTDKVCGITDIGFDHMQILGNTLSKISAQKIGIVHNNNHVFMYRQNSEVMRVVDDWTRQHAASLHIVQDRDFPNLYSIPEFQKRNLGLALEICNFVAKRDGFELVKSVNPSIQVPGRMERIRLYNGSTLILDGAHNQQKMETFVKSFQALLPGKKAAVMLALKEGKEHKEVIRAVIPICTEIILTTFDTAQDLPAKSQNPNELQEECKRLGVNSRIVIDNKKALKELVDSNGRLKLIIGSFYLLSQLRPHIQKILAN